MVHAWGFDINSASDFPGALPESLAWQGEVEVLLIQEKYEEAAGQVDQRLDAARRSGDASAEGGALHLRGKALHTQNRIEEARLAAAEALDKFTAAGCTKGEALALLDLAKLAVDAKEVTKAEKLSAEALEKYQGANSAIGQASVHLLMARMHDRDRNVDDAVKQAEKALALFRKAGEKEGQAAAQLAKGNAVLWNYRDAQDEAIRLGREAARLCRQVQRPASRHREADALYLVACASYPLGKHKDGLKAAEDSVALLQQVGGPRAQASSMRAVALGCMQLAEHAKAAEVAERMLSILRGGDDRTLLAEAMAVDSLVHRQRVSEGNLAEQDLMVQKARDVLDAFMALEDEEAVAVHRLELAQALLLASDTSTALAEASIALESFRKQNAKAGQGLCLLTVAQAQSLMGDAKTAADTAGKAQALLVEGGSPNEGAELIESLKKQGAAQRGQKWAEQRAWGTYQVPKGEHEVKEDSGIKRSMYSSIINARLHIGDTPEALSFDGQALMYMDKILGVPMPFLKNAAPPLPPGVGGR